MITVLLSGGSGKRLWPLSNEIRSKQFLKLFKCSNGYESMLQRTYRQITKANKNAKILVATSKAQVSNIKNQLGDKVLISIEPCLRDTFPAIALSAAYLFYEKSVDENETIIVCPVDPFVDDSYYDTFNELERIVSSEKSKLTLLGIEPSCPSEKYGYIIPCADERVSKVKEFKEKPDRSTAQKYIDEGALWNAGVFAFKLGYLLDKAHQLIDFKSYDDFYEKYSDLSKISFDYAVVEKENSIQVLRYHGEWRDVGTWSAIVNTIDDKVIGNAYLGTDCKNTCVLNETSVPVLCMGCNDMMVAVSNDGILISNLDCVDKVKPYVEKMDVLNRYVEKSWGTYTVMDSNPTSITAKISIKHDCHMSYHLHNFRKEVWVIISGRGRVILDDIEKSAGPGAIVEIPAGCKHTIEAIEDLVLMEVQMGNTISKSDKVKVTYRGK